MFRERCVPKKGGLETRPYKPPDLCAASPPPPHTREKQSVLRVIAGESVGPSAAFAKLP
jgi:hypothetical protein